MAGGTPAENRAIVESILEGKPGPCTDFVLMQAAAALWVSGKASDLKAGVDLARTALKAGKCKAVLDGYIK